MIEKINLIMPHRPLTISRIMSPTCKIVQQEDGSWVADDNVMRAMYKTVEGKIDKPEYPKSYDDVHSMGDVAYKGRRKIQDTIRMLNKNSFFKYDIVVTMDSDVFPNSTFLREFSNVKIFKSSYVSSIPSTDTGFHYSSAWWRINHAFHDAINNIPDNEWIGFAFPDDFLCTKNWDKRIIETIESEGDKQVYCPFLVESGPNPAHVPSLVVNSDWNITYENIWKEWRKLGRTCLIQPPPKRGYLNYEDLEEFQKIAKYPPQPSEHGAIETNGNIKEPCGYRIYGSFAPLFLKSQYAKYAISKSLIGPGWDFIFDNVLGELQLTKVVVGSSFVFHPSMEYSENG